MRTTEQAQQPSQTDAMKASDRQGPSNQQAQRQQARQSTQQRQQRQQQQQQQQQQRAFTHVIAGALLETREVTLKGVPDKHVLGRIQTPQGRQVLVDLGTRQDLQDVRLTRGEIIAATGRFGRINGRPVLFADRFADLVRIDRGGDAQPQQAGYRNNAEQRRREQQQQQQQRSSGQFDGNAQ